MVLRRVCEKSLPGARGLRRLMIWIAVLAAQGACACGASAVGPQISSISPAAGSAVGGQRVTITGSGFRGAAGACASGYLIAFGTDLVHGYPILAPSYQVLSDTQLSVVTPPNFGGSVDVRVANTCGVSPVSSGDRFQYQYPSSQCLAGTCSLAVGSSAGRALGHVALGFLDGFNTDAGVTITPKDQQLVLALHPRQWRLGQAWLTAPGGGVFGFARRAGAQISLDLTSDWEDWAYDADPRYDGAPYGDLATYYSFIYNDVKQRMAAGEVPDYFDVWNEPTADGTVNQWLSVYGTAYRAIKAADPSAQVVGPSIDNFLATSANQPNTRGYELSMADFLNWEMASGNRFAAISWHEDGTTVDRLSNGLPVPGGSRDYWSPAAIGNHVRAAKSLLAQYPSLAGTKIFVNEYGPTYGVDIPGWLVGDFAALEQSGADQGMMTCPVAADCGQLLDGLISADGNPQMPYWVMQAYSQMSGSMLPVSSSASNIYAVATATPSHTIDALIGRADDCFGGDQCPQSQPSTSPSVTLSLSLAVPWSTRAVSVSVEPMPNSPTASGEQNTVPTQPAATSTTASVSYGSAHVSIPTVRDGDAFYLVVSPIGSVKAQRVARRCSRTRSRRVSRHRRRACRARR